MHERHVRFAGSRVVQYRVTRAKSAARAILTRQSHWDPIQKQRSERERLGVVPRIGAAVLEYFALIIDDDAFNLWLDLETFRDAGETIDDRLERFLIDRRWLG